MRATLLLLTLLYPLITFSQQRLTGSVVDAATQKPLPFATIIAGNDKTRGVTSNLEGHFHIILKSTDSFVQVSYMGYISRSISIDSLRSNPTIALTSTNFNLNEVTILPTENPAHRIINNAVRAAESNNPDNLPSYSCRIYNKTLLKMEITPDSKLSKQKKQKIDSANLLIMESVVDRSYRYHDITEEKVVANRVSGFKNPPFTLMATTFQPFHFYKPNVELLGKQFLNPITPNSTKNYVFTIQDTLIHANDTTFVVQFTPRKGTNFEGLKGFLHINTHEWAIANVVAERAANENLTFRIEQQYALRRGKWFPDQYRYRIVMKNYPMGMGINSYYEGSGTVYDVMMSSKHVQPPKQNSLSIADSAAKAYSSIERYRSTPLSSRDSATYVKLDSLGTKLQIDDKMSAVPIIAQLKIPYKIFSIPIYSIWNANKHEGNRLGLGLETNRRLSRYWEVGGFFAYGTKDEQWKYGGMLSIYPKGNIKTKVELAYRNDVVKPTENFLVGERIGYLANRFLLDKADHIISYDVTAKTRIKDVGISLKGTKQEFAPTYSYLYKGIEQKNFWSNNTELMLDLRYGIREKETNFFNLYFYSTQDYPVMGLRVRKGMETADGSYSYTSIEAGIYKKFSIRKAGELRATAIGGYLSGEVPYSLAFGSNSTNSWFFSFVVNNSFACAAPFEYASTQYANLFLYYDLNSLLFSTKKFKPMVSIFQAAGWSELGTKNLYQRLAVKDMHDGYFESGLILSNLVRVKYFNLVYLGIGAGAFVAYGNAVSKPVDETLTLKMTLTLDF